MSKTIREALDNYCETLTGQRPETRTILDSLNAITEANGGTPSQGGLVDAIDCFCACSGGGAQSVVFAEGLTAFDPTPATMCASITELNIPEGVTALTPNAEFFVDEEYGDEYWKTNGVYDVYTSLSKITIPRTITEIAAGAFYGVTTLKEISIPNTATSIGDAAFYECTNLSEITFPENVTRIGTEAFYSCTKLTSVEIPSTVGELGRNVFGGCSGLVSAVISTQDTGNSTFGGGCSSLSDVVLSDGVVTIGSGTFTACTALTEIEIPSTVTTIAADAFYNCKNLTKITVNKPEGSIAGAPWGASNATVVWTG